MAFNINFNMKWLILPIILIIGFSIFSVNQCNNNKQLENYNRQLNGNLSDTERELQSANHSLGIAESKLVTQKDLVKKLKNENEEKDGKFDEFTKEHNLEIVSLDTTIARLRQQLNSGTTEVIVSNDCNTIEDRCAISYSWSDPYNRFELKDPDIFKKDNEVFESTQLFKIYGEVWQQKDGSLQTRRLVLREMFVGKDGKYEPIPGAKAEIVESSFQYHNPPKLDLEWDWTDLFHFRVLALGGVSVFPDSGDIRLGLGVEFFNWNGIGINTNIGFDFDDPKHIAHYIGVSYSPAIDDFKLNVGIGASIGTPYYNMFKDMSFKIDLIFYLHE